MEFPELFRVVLLVVALPMFLMLARRLRPAKDATMLAGAFTVICVAYFATVLEDLTPFTALFDAIQHIGYAIAGIMAAIGCYRVRRAILAERRAS